MTVILCVDSGRGMTFFGRRQSTDSAVTERIVRFADGARLLIGVDSAPLFKGRKVNAVVSDDLLSDAMPGDVCFLERDDPAPYAAVADRLVIYRWNRNYPRDRKVGFFPYDEGMKLSRISDFSGNSHLRITEEIWEKR